MNRIHRDLVEALGSLADDAGMSRSAYIERILVDAVRRHPRYADLDHMGRRRPTPALPPRSAADMADRFEAIRRAVFGDAPEAGADAAWERFKSLRRAVLGDDVPEPRRDLTAEPEEELRIIPHRGHRGPRG